MSKKFNNEKGINARKSVREYLDFDYYDALSDDEKEWLTRFVREEYHGMFRDDGTDLTTNQDQRRKIWREGEARKRDMFNQWDRAPGDCSLVPDEEDEDA